MEGVFVAGDGDLSIVYQHGAHVWGTWNATYSAGVEPEDFEADRSLGFVGDVGHTGDELASRMWIRSDVSIDQDGQVSTVPQVFRDALERTSGDVVVERTISGAGLGGLVPYVDFRHGDEMGTVIGSKVVPLPVTGIEYGTDVESELDYSVEVGEGLLGNREERDLRNAQLQSQISKEIAERKREIEEQRQRSNQINRGLTGTDHGDILAAAKGSEGALGTLNQVDIRTDGEVENVRRGIVGRAQNTQYETLGGMNEIAQVLRDNFLNRYYTDENGRTRNMLTSSELSRAEDGLIPAYVAMNNVMWEQQMLINAVHGEAIDANNQAIEALERAQLAITYIPRGTTTTTVNGHLSFDPPAFGQIPQRIRVRRRNSLWRGRIVALTNIQKISLGLGDHQIHTGYATDWHMGSNNYADINLGEGDVANIVVIHQTYNPHQL